MADFRTQNNVICPIESGNNQGWRGEIHLKNGTVVDMSQIAYLNAWNPYVGLAIEYGWRIDTEYDQFMINEKFGGGNAVGCFFQKDGKVYVGLTCEKRNGGQEQWELPRFFCGTRNETRRKSFQENLEKDNFDFNAVLPMNGPVNCNSAYNYTADSTEGLQIFCVQVEYNGNRFFYDKDTDSFVFYNLAMIERDKSTKRIVDSRFFNIDTLCVNQDVFANAWVGKFWTFVRKGLIKLR
jgi:hypothetical protein